MSTDELARLERAFITVHPDDRPRTDCPAAERIWDGVHGQVGPREMRELLDHVAVCPLCTEAWRLARELEEGYVREGTWSTPWRKLAVAATVAVALLAGTTLYWQNDEVEPSPYRAGAEAPVIELLDEGPLSRDDGLLRWGGPENAVHYNLRIAAESEPMRPLVEEHELEVSTYRIPPEVLAELPPGTQLQIYLEVVDDVGGGSSRTFVRELL